ncbi:MAG: glycosyltransferase [Pyrinomonadaceae bacterium]
MKNSCGRKFFEELRHPKESSEAFKIITVGGLIWRKGQNTALQAVKHLVDEGHNVQFDIIGSGPDISRLLYTIEDFGLEKIVHLHGSLTRSEVRLA